MPDLLTTTPLVAYEHHVPADGPGRPGADLYVSCHDKVTWELYASSDYPLTPRQARQFAAALLAAADALEAATAQPATLTPADVVDVMLVHGFSNSVAQTALTAYLGGPADDGWSLTGADLHAIMVQAVADTDGGPTRWESAVMDADGHGLVTVDVRTLPHTRLDVLRVEAAAAGDLLGAALYAAAVEVSR